jgi:hypothetical protein
MYLSLIEYTDSGILEVARDFNSNSIRAIEFLNGIYLTIYLTI